MVTSFDRETMARFYARRHLETDPGIVEIYYLPEAPKSEIRSIEVNRFIADIEKNPLLPFDFGVDAGLPSEHHILILDLTPNQWSRIDEFTLPEGWDLSNKISLGKN